MTITICARQRRVMKARELPVLWRLPTSERAAVLGFEQSTQLRSAERGGGVTFIEE
jgi:hypothetical protein